MRQKNTKVWIDNRFLNVLSSQKAKLHNQSYHSCKYFLFCNFAEVNEYVAQSQEKERGAMQCVKPEFIHKTENSFKHFCFLSFSVTHFFSFMTLALYQQSKQRLITNSCVKCNPTIRVVSRSAFLKTHQGPYKNLIYYVLFHRDKLFFFIFSLGDRNGLP